ncbi:aldo/keto reductase [Roseovarius pacificus]|uniref:aldo/keto reductase n=1 Tax=Roseovarius pacificus TaxID=337701 RepID=UPI003749C7C1
MAALKKRYLPVCLRDNLGVLARVPLASGFLTGKYQRGVSFPPGDYRGKQSQESLDAKADQAAEILRKEVPEGVNMAAWAIAWCLKHDAVACVIPGARNAAQLRANASASELADGNHPLSM